MKYVCELLGMSTNRITPLQENCNGKLCPSFLLRSFVNEELLKVYRLWYSDKKVVPNSLLLTKKTLLHWFMDDGSTSWRTDRKSKQVRLVFCSESFTKEENEFLVCQLRSNFDLKASVKRCPSGSGYRIGIGQSSIVQFFDVIGPCPVPSMEYKWKTP